MAVVVAQVLGKPGLLGGTFLHLIETPHGLRQ